MFPRGRVLVTGAGGFIGRSLLPRMRASGYPVVAAVRGGANRSPIGADALVVGDLRKFSNWDAALNGVDAVIHLAARAHIVAEYCPNPLMEFRDANVAPTIALFRACQKAVVRRFVFVSSIGVNGAANCGNQPFSVLDLPNPSEPYAISKWEAEEALRNLAGSGSTELVVVRPALVYGPHAKGNVLRLMQWVNRRIPLPLGAVTATRSVLGLTNCCDLLIRCISHPLAPGQTFLAADPAGRSTKGLILAIAGEMKRSPMLIPVPQRLLEISGSLFGIRKEIDRMCASLMVDSLPAREMLGWPADIPIEIEISAMVRQFLLEEGS